MQAATGDVIEVRVVGRLDGQETVNVWHFKATAPVDDIELALIQAIIACITDNLVPVATNDWNLEKVQYMRVSPTTSALLEVVAGADVSTGNGGDGLPGFCAALISLRTEFAGKSGRGRKYIPGVPEEATNAGTIDGNSAFWEALLAFVVCVANKFIGTIAVPATEDFRLQVLSRKLGNAKAPYNANQFHDVVTMVANPVVASMRSRRIGHGS